MCQKKRSSFYQANINFVILIELASVRMLIAKPTYSTPGRSAKKKPIRALHFEKAPKSATARYIERERKGGGGGGGECTEFPESFLSVCRQYSRGREREGGAQTGIREIEAKLKFVCNFEQKGLSLVSARWEKPFV